MNERGAIQMVAYKTIAGQSYPIGSIGKSDLRLRVINTTEDECREYAATLEAMGYRRCAVREIPAGSEYAYNVNLYYAYENEDSSVSVFWDASMRTVFITAEERRATPAVTAKKSENPSVVAPTFTQMELHDGMCYILQVSHHGLIGGYKRLYQIVDPEICFWPTAERRFLGLKEGQRYQWCLGEGGCDYNAYLRDNSIRERTHYTHSTTTTIKV